MFRPRLAVGAPHSQATTALVPDSHYWPRGFLPPKNQETALGSLSNKHTYVVSRGSWLWSCQDWSFGVYTRKGSSSKAPSKPMSDRCRYYAAIWSLWDEDLIRASREPVGGLSGDSVSKAKLGSY